MKSKTTVVILIVSLAVNLLFIGGTIGFFLQEKPGPKFPTHLGKVLENLDSEKKGVMRQRLKEFREQSRPLHRDMRREQRALAKVILSDPFDQAAAREAFSRTQDSQIALQTHMFEQMVPKFTIRPKPAAAIDGENALHRRTTDKVFFW